MYAARQPWLRLRAFRVAGAPLWRRWSLTALVGLSLFISVPGALEVARDLAQWVRDGHTVHAACDRDQDRHEPDAEHGCSGLFHLCQCCAHIHVLPQLQVLHIAGADPSAAERAAAPARFVLAGYRAPPFRPPSART
jgi:hypothetical protein